MLPTDLVQWPPLVRAALEAWREGNLLALAESPLAHSALVEDCGLAGEPRTPDMRARALQAVLRWGVERLRPDGAYRWPANAWRAYNILFHFYGEGERLS